MRLLLLLTAALLANVSAHAQTVDSIDPPSDAARCIALTERMPEITSASRQMFGALAADDDPEISALAKAILKLLEGIDGLAPLLAEAEQLQRAELLATIRERLPTDQRETASAVMEAELKAARREYAGIKLHPSDPNLQSYIDVYKQEHERRCRSEAA